MKTKLETLTLAMIAGAVGIVTLIFSCFRSFRVPLPVQENSYISTRTQNSLGSPLLQIQTNATALLAERVTLPNVAHTIESCGFPHCSPVVRGEQLPNSKTHPKLAHAV